MADLYLTWADIETLTDQLVEQLQGKQFDLYLAIARGGLIPAGLLAKRLKHRRVLVASVQYYDEDDQRLENPILLEFPAETYLHGKRVLIIDDVWDTGHTISLVRKIVARAGSLPFVATYHFKPFRSQVEGRPDFYVAETEDWVHYPWEPNYQGL